MKTISLKLDDEISKETEEVLSVLKKARNRYINEAIDHYNKINKRKQLEAQLKIESKNVRDSSLEVLREFEQFEDEA